MPKAGEVSVVVSYFSKVPLGTKVESSFTLSHDLVPPFGIGSFCSLCISLGLLLPKAGEVSVVVDLLCKPQSVVGQGPQVGLHSLALLNNRASCHPVVQPQRIHLLLKRSQLPLQGLDGCIGPLQGRGVQSEGPGLDLCVTLRRCPRGNISSGQLLRLVDSGGKVRGKCRFGPHGQGLHRLQEACHYLGLVCQGANLPFGESRYPSTRSRLED